MTEVRCQPWGNLPSKVDLWTLQSSQVKVEILTLGAIIRSIYSKGKDGQMDDVVLGYDDLEGYVLDKRYFGAVVGRVANRIAQGCFVVDGKTYRLEINNGPNALHGGSRGFNKAIWIATAVECGVKMCLTSPDGDQGYPGEMQVSVTYTLQEGTLTAEYQAQSTKTTPINLTNHSYFNLGGQVKGEIKAVDGSPFDLRQPVLIGPQLKKVPGSGFDHNFCLSSPGDPWTEKTAARIYHPGSGRILEVSTSQPGVQFYTANVLDGSIIGKGGVKYGKHCAFCLETQNWPDAVNQASFPDCLLHPDEEYRHLTRFTFTYAD
ncbi:aldose 1-epimerase isoform X2 [Corythoichthys intestinalis]|uniref:aldose 1-epimerase isoform X2 n=1 Tax=Corythoichthys intestinalis TaxID=161448 RepID=UPI0025A6562E|nr:aldose 1-epimerase isoform X2 [Corythoichthys intestinalis]